MFAAYVDHVRGRRIRLILAGRSLGVRPDIHAAASTPGSHWLILWLVRNGRTVFRGDWPADLGALNVIHKSSSAYGCAQRAGDRYSRTASVDVCQLPHPAARFGSSPELEGNRGQHTDHGVEALRRL